MAHYEQSVVIMRPVETVFAYMDDIALEPEWQPQLVEAEQLPPGPTAVGSRKRYVSEFLGKRLENIYVVRTYEPNARLVCETTPDSVLAATSDVRWEPVEGGTRVTMSVDGSASGPLRFIPARIIEAKFAAEVDATLARLKERLEGSA